MIVGCNNTHLDASHKACLGTSYLQGGCISDKIRQDLPFETMHINTDPFSKTCMGGSAGVYEKCAAPPLWGRIQSRGL